MTALNAFMFFNSGFNSGASQMHKHIQVVPYESLGGNGKDIFIPVEDCALKYYNNNKL